MNQPCSAIQEQLAESGAAAVRQDAALARHVAGCADCTQVLRDLERLDGALAALPRPDAPGALVARTLERVRATPGAVSGASEPVASAATGPSRGRLRDLLAHRRRLAAASLLLVAGATGWLLLQRPSFRDRGIPDLKTPGGARSLPLPAAGVDHPMEPRGTFRTDAEGAAVEPPSAPARAVPPPVAQPAPKAETERQLPGGSAGAGREADLRSELGELKKQAEKPRLADDDDAEQLVAGGKLDARRKLRERRDLDPAPGLGSRGEELDKDGGLPAAPAPPASADRARAFLAERSALEGLRFQPATGYWANTYVPGDPELRWLRARIHERSASLPTPSLVLDRATRCYLQPFDPPADAALALYLQADRRALEGRTRLLLQVGIKAAERHAASRPGMQLAVLLDLRGAPAPEALPAVRALLAALAEARQMGDRFSLHVAGRADLAPLGPEEFRHGPLAVLLDRAATGGQEPSGFELRQAFESALATLTAAEDPASPLGASEVLLVTARELGSEQDALVDLAHQGALSGISTSVVGVGPRVSPQELELVVLAGQGSRRLLGEPAEAGALVDRELHAASRVVARALRLRIRLAPGVELVDVLGSHRLDVASAERVRRAEQSIDQRVARSLGIQADRGEDEEGIQIVIPAYYAGDEHVILLDVVAPGPGPVADVRLRFKDLAFLRNGVARSALSLEAGSTGPGPLELSVLRNLLALRTSQAVRRAGDSLGAGDTGAGAAVLRAQLELVGGLRAWVSGWAQDPEIAADAGMLASYLQLLDRGVADDPGLRSLVADSLLSTSFLKLTNPLDEWPRATQEPR